MSYDDLGPELSSAILAAITGETSDVPVARVSTFEQIQYIMKYSDSLEVKDRINLGRILIMNDRRSSLCPSSTGTVINLDLLPPYIIDQMYEFVLYKINA